MVVMVVAVVALVSIIYRGDEGWISGLSIAALCHDLQRIRKNAKYVPYSLPLLRYNGNLVIPDALTSQSHLVITDKLKFWWSRYNGNLVLHVRYSMYMFDMQHGYSEFSKQQVMCMCSLIPKSL